MGLAEDRTVRGQAPFRFRGPPESLATPKKHGTRLRRPARSAMIPSLPIRVTESCPDCGSRTELHDEECILAEHQAALGGDTLAAAVHDSEECELCLLQHEVRCRCRCGVCCESLLVEATALDARREPKIAERASIIDEGGEIPRDQAGWLLNGRGGACVFFHRDADGRGVCEIHNTRPLCCRLFDCDTDERAIEFRQQLSNTTHD